MIAKQNPPKPSPAGNEQPIAVIRKNAREEVLVNLAEFNGHQLLSIRVWAGHGQSQERVPTKKGVAINISLLPELRAALELAERKARAAGLLAGGAG